MSLKPDTIRAIFTNILFLIGVVLLIVGFGRGTLTLANIVTFDEYPLAGYEESRCDYIAPAPVEKLPNEETKENCLKSLDQQRKQKQVDDIVTSITMLVSGAALVSLFKRFIIKG